MNILFLILERRDLQAVRERERVPGRRGHRSWAAQEGRTREDSRQNGQHLNLV